VKKIITAQEAPQRAHEILEHPADDPENGWELEEFPQGWAVHWRGWKGEPDEFTIVIERDRGIVNYFATLIPQQSITGDYAAVRHLGRSDEHMFEEEPARPPHSSRAAPGQQRGSGGARRPGTAGPHR
jgi:hypothetical protein